MSEIVQAKPFEPGASAYQRPGALEIRPGLSRIRASNLVAEAGQGGENLKGRGVEDDGLSARLRGRQVQQSPLEIDEPPF